MWRTHSCVPCRHSCRHPAATSSVCPTLFPAQILIPLQIRSRRPDACDIQLPIAIQIAHRAPRRRHLSALIQQRLHPLLAVIPIKIHIRPAPIPRNDHIAIAAIQIRSQQYVAVHDRRINHAAPPLCAVLRIDSDRIPVPRFNGRQESLLPDFPDRDIASATLRPRVRTPRRDLRPLPLPVLHLPIQKDPLKARRQ